jgi:hypothetical protein
MAESTSLIERNKVFEYVRTLLGDQIVEVELDPIHYEIALNRALDRYRQRSSNSVEESYSFLELIPDQNEYRLPDEIITVHTVFRRSLGSKSGSSSGGFDPFHLAYTNSYLLSGSMIGGLATYELFTGYQKLVGTMFGAFIEFTWKPQSHILTILQRPLAQGEQLLLKTYNYRPDFVLLTDVLAKQWLKDYTLATCKMILGEARSKFSSIAGPSQSIQMNGSDLKNAAKEELAALDKEIETYVTGGAPLTWVMG